MFERIEAKRITGNLWIGTETLRNYDGHTLDSVRTALYNQMPKAMKDGTMCITVIILDKYHNSFNLSIRLDNRSTLGDICNTIEELIATIERKLVVE